MGDPGEESDIPRPRVVCPKRAILSSEREEHLTWSLSGRIGNRFFKLEGFDPENGDQGQQAEGWDGCCPKCGADLHSLGFLQVSLPRWGNSSWEGQKIQIVDGGA